MSAQSREIRDHRFHDSETRRMNTSALDLPCSGDQKVRTDLDRDHDPREHRESALKGRSKAGGLASHPRGIDANLALQRQHRDCQRVSRRR